MSFPKSSATLVRPVLASACKMALKFLRDRSSGFGEDGYVSTLIPRPRLQDSSQPLHGLNPWIGGVPIGDLLERGERDFRSVSDQGPLVAGQLEQASNNGFMEAHYPPFSTFGEMCQPLSERCDKRRSVGEANVAVMRHPSQNQPVGMKPFVLPKGVDPKSLPAIVARNVWGLMASDPSLSSQMALSKKAGIGQATVDRILKATSGTRLDNIELLAAAFGLQAWHLLLPGLDPKNPPVVSLTRTERELYERLTKAAKQVLDHDQRGRSGNRSRVSDGD